MTRDVLVIGGGLAGGAAALRLARAGRDVLLLERTPGPHDKVCGEFLSYEAQDELRDLGLDPRALGAVPIRLAGVEGPRARCATPLPFEALSLSRRVLDETLLARAAREGAEVRRGARATLVERDGSSWAIRVDGGTTLAAREVILATGKHDLRGQRRPPGRQPDLLGFKMYWTLAEPRDLPGRVELHLFSGGYAGLQMVEGRRANLCLVVRQSAFTAMGGTWEALLARLLEAAPALGVRLAGAEPSLAKPLAISAIPYGLVQERSEGLWRLGDQAAVIPSFTGEGMSIALHSARKAAEGLVAGEVAETFQRRLASELRGQVRRSTLISRSLVTPWAQAAIVPLLTPSVLRWILHRTRIPESARGWPVALEQP